MKVQAIPGLLLVASLILLTPLSYASSDDQSRLGLADILDRSRLRVQKMLDEGVDMPSEAKAKVEEGVKLMSEAIDDLRAGRDAWSKASKAMSMIREGLSMAKPSDEDEKSLMASSAASRAMVVARKLERIVEERGIKPTQGYSITPARAILVNAVRLASEGKVSDAKSAIALARKMLSRAAENIHDKLTPARIIAIKRFLNNTIVKIEKMEARVAVVAVSPKAVESVRSALERAKNGIGAAQAEIESDKVEAALDRVKESLKAIAEGTIKMANKTKLLKEKLKTRFEALKQDLDEIADKVTSLRDKGIETIRIEKLLSMAKRMLEKAWDSIDDNHLIKAQSQLRTVEKMLNRATSMLKILESRSWDPSVDLTGLMDHSP